MVPLSARRHRLDESEIPEVTRGLLLRLKQLFEEKSEPEKAEVTLRCLMRLKRATQGRPQNLNFSWDLVEYTVDSEELIIKEIEKKG